MIDEIFQKGIWRIQPLEAERTGSFNSSMYKSTRLFVDLLLQFDEHSWVLFEVLRQLLDKPDAEKYDQIFFGVKKSRKETMDFF